MDFIYAVLHAICETAVKIPRKTLQLTRVYIHLLLLANTCLIGDESSVLHTVQQQIAYIEQLLCFDEPKPQGYAAAAAAVAVKQQSQPITEAPPMAQQPYNVGPQDQVIGAHETLKQAGTEILNNLQQVAADNQAINAQQAQHYQDGQ